MAEQQNAAVTGETNLATGLTAPSQAHGTTPAAPPSAQRVGGCLRAARERLGWSLPDTSAYVRIRLPFLQALEDGRVADLPGPVYALGFVRSYALALGVDPEEMVRRYHEETGVAPPARLDFPSPVPQRHVPAGTVVMLGALLAIGAYAGWYRSSDERPMTVAVQQVPARLAPLVLPLVPPPPAHVAAAAPVTTPPILAYVRPPVPPGAAEAAIPDSANLLPVTPPLASTSTHVVLAATADAWIQVKDAQGRVVFSRLMHQGDTWPVPDQPAGSPALILTTGNAGGTSLTVDGKPHPALGSPGAVLRDLPLDPATLGAHA